LDQAKRSVEIKEVRSDDKRLTDEQDAESDPEHAQRQRRGRESRETGPRLN
jgi:hypothetical protein